MAQLVPDLLLQIIPKTGVSRYKLTLTRICLGALPSTQQSEIAVKASHSEELHKLFYQKKACLHGCRSANQSNWCKIQKPARHVQTDILASLTTVWQARKPAQTTCGGKATTEAQPVEMWTYATVTCW